MLSITSITKLNKSHNFVVTTLDMAYIETIGYNDSEGELRKAYDDLIKSRGKLAAIHEIHSLKPSALVKHMDLYMDLMYGDSGLKRYQREMIGVIVSICNKCIYCVKHHGEALIYLWEDEAKVGALYQNYTKAGLNDKDLLLCLFAEQLTLKPEFKGKPELIKRLKEQGLEEKDVLDATLIIAYFNFVNRIVLGLGVSSKDDEEIKGYNYD